MTMTNKTLKCYKAATVLIPVAVVFLYNIRNFFIQLTEALPPCPVYTNFHLYCPACGNTRCVKALFRGDLLMALHYNISPVIVGIFAVLAYAELAAFSFGKPIRILPRKLSFYLILITLLMLYVILRNFIPPLAP
jgi:hypothetical protein